MVMLWNERFLLFVKLYASVRKFRVKNWGLYSSTYLICHTYAVYPPGVSLYEHPTAIVFVLFCFSGPCLSLPVSIRSQAALFSTRLQDRLSSSSPSSHTASVSDRTRVWRRYRFSGRDRLSGTHSLCRVWVPAQACEHSSQSPHGPHSPGTEIQAKKSDVL